LERSHGLVLKALSSLSSGAVLLSSRQGVQIIPAYTHQNCSSDLQNLRRRYTKRSLAIVLVVGLANLTANQEEQNRHAHYFSCMDYQQEFIHCSQAIELPALPECAQLMPDIILNQPPLLVIDRLGNV
jgi:hypothetical protein